MKASFRQKPYPALKDSAADGYERFKKHLQQFSPLTASEFKEVLACVTELVIDKNDYLITAQGWVRHTYWVKKGLLVSTFLDEQGKEHLIQFAIENCWITDQDAFYNQQKARLNVIALEKSELLCLSFENREKLCAQLPSMEQFFRRKANDSFVKQQSRLITYLTADTKRRYQLLLEEYPGISQRVSKKLLAAYLGVSRETLSRL